MLRSQRISRISRICAEDAVTSDGEEKITLQRGRKELEKINMSLHAQLQKKDEEIANLQAQTEQAFEGWADGRYTAQS